MLSLPTAEAMGVADLEVTTRRNTHTMKKFILGGLGAAAVIAPIAMTAGSANAAVERQCETAVTSTVTTTTATFTVNQPKDTVGQFANVWKHVYTITVEPSGAFSGTGSVTANGAGEVVWTETITGQFMDSDSDKVSDHVTFNTTPNKGVTFSVTDAPMDSTTVPVASPWEPNAIEFRIAQPEFETVTVNGETDYANHGEYVAAMGGGKAAAQKCTGMPLTSKKGQLEG
jgi:hypothetical protein